MNYKLRIAIRVIRRRVNAGETLDTVLLDYPGMTPEERKQVEEVMREK